MPPLSHHSAVMVTVNAVPAVGVPGVGLLTEKRSGVDPPGGYVHVVASSVLGADEADPEKLKALEKPEPTEEAMPVAATVPNDAPPNPTRPPSSAAVRTTAATSRARGARMPPPPASPAMCATDEARNSSLGRGLDRARRRSNSACPHSRFLIDTQCPGQDAAPSSLSTAAVQLFLQIREIALRSSTKNRHARASNGLRALAFALATRPAAPGLAFASCQRVQLEESFATA